MSQPMNMIVRTYGSTNEYHCKNRSLTVDKEFTDNNFHTLRNSHHVFLPQIEVVVLVYPNKHHSFNYSQNCLI